MSKERSQPVELSVDEILYKNIGIASTVLGTEIDVTSLTHSALATLTALKDKNAHNIVYANRYTLNKGVTQPLADLRRECNIGTFQEAPLVPGSIGLVLSHPLLRTGREHTYIANLGLARIRSIDQSTVTYDEATVGTCFYGEVKVLNASSSSHYIPAGDKVKRTRLLSSQICICPSFDLAHSTIEYASAPYSNF